VAPEIEHMEEYTVLDLSRKFDLEKLVVYSLGICLIRLKLLLTESEFFELKKKKDLKGILILIDDE
jgi:hypothetical protein